jgi:hypothetical protein
MVESVGKAGSGQPQNSGSATLASGSPVSGRSRCCSDDCSYTRYSHVASHRDGTNARRFKPSRISRSTPKISPKEGARFASCWTTPPCPRAPRRPWNAYEHATWERLSPSRCKRRFPFRPRWTVGFGRQRFDPPVKRFRRAPIPLSHVSSRWRTTAMRPKSLPSSRRHRPLTPSRLEAASVRSPHPLGHAAGEGRCLWLDLAAAPSTALLAKSLAQSSLVRPFRQRTEEGRRGNPRLAWSEEAP